MHAPESRRRSSVERTYLQSSESGEFLLKPSTKKQQNQTDAVGHRPRKNGRLRLLRVRGETLERIPDLERDRGDDSAKDGGAAVGNTKVADARPRFKSSRGVVRR